jgi:hypothetical protein
MRQLRRLRQLEHDRAFARLDHAGHEGFVAIGQRRLGPHPAGLHVLLRPQHHYGLGGPQRRFRHLVMGLARAQAHVPPDLEALGLEGIREELRAGLVFAVIGKEDVGHAGPRIDQHDS